MILTTPHQITMARLAGLKGAVKLESVGLKRRGKSATAIAKAMLGLPKGTSREAVILALQERLDMMHNITQPAEA